MIDIKGRQRLADNQQQKNTVNGFFQSVSEAVDLKKENKQLMEQVMQKDDLVAEKFDKLGTAVAMIYRALPKAIKLPDVFKIMGKVEVTKPVTIDNLSAIGPYFQSLEKRIGSMKPEQFPAGFVVDNLFELKEYFDSLEKRIGAIADAISKIPATKIDLPKYPDVKPQKLDFKEVTTSIESLEETLVLHFDQLTTNAFNTSQNDDLARAFGRVEQSINALVARPQMTPQPVTHVSINALQGTLHTTAQTLETARAPLPSYGVLQNRRAVTIYNNSLNTIYVGGSDVTVTNGMPIPAGAYSQVFDFGVNTILYGIAATLGNNIRVLEASDEGSGR